MKLAPALLSVAILAGVTTGTVRATEPAQAFLDGLRERKFFDTATEYIDSAAANPNVSAQFKQAVLYEKGLTLVQSADLQRDPALREKQLDDSQKLLQEFLTQRPGHLLATAARNQLGNVLLKRAAGRVEKSKKLPADQQQAAVQEAVGLFDQAHAQFVALAKDLAERLKQYPAALDEKKEPQRFAERLQFRSDSLQAQLLAAAALESKSAAFTANSKEQSEALTRAADGYKEVYEQNRTRFFGLYARAYQGRCLHKLGKFKEASAIFTELLANPDDKPEFHALKVVVMPLAVESWFSQKLYLEIVNRAVPLIDSLRGAEDKTDDAMALRLTTARACKAYADEIRKEKPRDPQPKQLASEGRKLVLYAAKFPNVHQETARKLLAEFGAAEAGAPQRPDPKTFDEAATAARDAITALQEAQQLLNLLPPRIAAEKDAATKAELEQQLTAAKQARAPKQDDAFHFCRLALKLADRGSNLDTLNLVRYLLCYLHYQEANYFDAAALGEFLARRYPDSQGARPCAKIALASYLKLYAENQTEDKAYETGRIIDICDYITRQWPDQPEADEALNTLIPFMIREKKLQEAQDYLQKIPEKSPHRASAELKTGQALWASYLDNSKQLRDWETGAVQLPDNIDVAARKQDLQQLKTRAKKTLVDGVERMKTAGDSGQVIATAVLSLAQIYVDTGQAAEAVALLEDPQLGSLTLLGKKDPATQTRGFPEETFKTALRAYISALAGSSDPAATIEKAKGVMASLKEYMGQTDTGKQMLVAIYVSLARDLQRQLEIADPQAKSALGKGFEVFLEPVAEDASELDVLNWVAETYRGMGESFVAGSDKKVSPEATGYFDKAGKTYQKILDLGQKNASFLTGPMTTQIRLQLAKTRRSKLEYKEAMDIFEAILKATPTMLPVQIEAARTYQDWGAQPGKDMEQNYLRAMLGARQDKTNPDATKQSRNIIWGWGELANRTAGDPRFRDQFHEARFNLALCRYNYALRLNDKTKKVDSLKRAVQDITVTLALYGASADAKWKTQYDTLLKNVQKALGERPVGLQALEKNNPPAGSTPGGKAAPPASPTTTNTAAAEK